MEIDAVRAAAQAQQAEALEQWRMAQTQALENKAIQEQAAEKQEQERLGGYLKAVDSGIPKRKAADQFLLGTKHYGPVNQGIASEEREKARALKPSTTPQPTEAERGFEGLQRVLKESAAAKAGQEAERAARDNPLRTLKEIEAPIQSNPELMLREEFYRGQAGMTKTKAAEDKFTDKENKELAVLRSEKSRLEKLSDRTKLKEEEEDSLIGINKRIAELTGVQGLDMTKTAKPASKGEEIKLPNGKTFFKRPATP
jgi:hypothetical protein